jgi:hypothetical protein
MLRLKALRMRRPSGVSSGPAVLPCTMNSAFPGVSFSMASMAVRYSSSSPGVAPALR